MSEHTPDIQQQFDQLLDEAQLRELEVAVTDPRYDEVVNLARGVNEQLYTSLSIDPEEVNRVVIALDEQWGIRGEPVYVTGRVHTRLASGEVKYVPVDSMLMYTDGFVGVRNEVHQDGVYLGDRYVIKHQFMMPRTTIDGTEVLECINAEIDGVIVRPRRSSHEHAGAWLQTYHEAIKAELDAGIDHIEGDETRLFEVFKDDTIRLDADADNTKLVSYVTEYINHAVSFDQHIPYGMLLRGAIIRPQPDGMDMFDSVDNDTWVIGGVSDIIALERCHVTEDGQQEHTLAFIAEVFVYESEPDTEPSFVRVPFRTIRQAESVRSLFYESKDQ